MHNTSSGIRSVTRACVEHISKTHAEMHCSGMWARMFEYLIVMYSHCVYVRFVLKIRVITPKVRTIKEFFWGWTRSFCWSRRLLEVTPKWCWAANIQNRCYDCGRSILPSLLVLTYVQSARPHQYINLAFEYIIGPMSKFHRNWFWCAASLTFSRHIQWKIFCPLKQITSINVNTNLHTGIVVCLSHHRKSALFLCWHLYKQM